MIGRWVLPAFALAVSTAYWPFWHDGAVSLKWCFLSALPMALFWVRPRMTVAHWALVFLIGYAAASALWSVAPLDTVNSVVKLALFGTVFIIAAEAGNLRPTYAAAAIGISLSGIIALAEVMGWMSLPEANHPAALFGNKNYMAETAAIAMIVAIYHRLWWALPGMALALILPASRGALLAVALVAGMGIWRISRPLAVCSAVGSIAVVFSVIQIFDISSFGSVTTRLEIWQEALSHLTFFGHGFGSFQAMYPLVHDYGSILPYGRPEHAHNEFINLLFESGAPGSVAAAVFAICVWKHSGGPLRPALIGIFVICMFSFPLHLPASGFMAAVVAGDACARGYRLRRVSVDGREQLFAGYGIFRPSHGSLGV